MLTVIIIDSKSKHLNDEEHSRLERLIRPFRDGGESECSVRLCKWVREGKSIDAAVPTLYQSIEGHPIWRAIVVTDRPHEENEASSFVNPYDFAYPYPTDTDGSPILPDLLRLSYMLAGYPTLGVLGYKDAYAYYDPDYREYRYMKDADGKTVYKDEFDEITDEGKRERLVDSIDPDLDITEEDLTCVTIEEKHPPEVEEAHRRNTRMYSFRENHPVVLILLTLCDVPDYDYDEVARRAGSHKQGDTDDCFRKHNYPNGCRFLYYDIRNTRHTLYRRDLWKFWLLALTLAVNDMPSTSMQAHHLYKADIDIDPNALSSVYEQYLTKLAAVQAGLNEIRPPAIEESPDSGMDLVPTQRVAVTFDYISDDRLEVGMSGIGLASNCPQPEAVLWEERTRDCRKIVENALIKPKKVVALRAAETRERIDSYAGKEHLLDRFEVEAIERRIDELEPNVMNSMVFGKLDTNAYRKEAAQADAKVRKILGGRLTKRSIVELGAFALFVYLCGFAPYLVNAARMSIPTFGASFALVGVALLILALGALITLCFLRRRLLKVIKAYNKANREMLDRINEGADVFSDYFTNVCTFMFAKALMAGAVMKNDSIERQEKLKKEHLRMIRTEQKAAHGIFELYDVSLNIPQASPMFIDLEANQAHPHENKLYVLHRNSENETLRLGNTGEMLYAPYMFITGIDLERVNVHTAHHSRKGRKA